MKYKNELSIDEIKILQLEILKDIDDFCNINKINYFLAFGSLIGAIRHQGYIPWDDDIDIVMPRNDYTRFINTYNNYNDKYEVISPEIEDNFYAPYANVCDKRTILIEESLSHGKRPIGIKIDVFPLDGVPVDKKEYEKLSNLVNEYKYAIAAKNAKLWFFIKNKRLTFFRHVFFRIKYAFVSKRVLHEKLRSIATSNNYETSMYVDDVVFNPYANAKTPREAFDSYMLSKFENYMFRIPIGYDAFLKANYGDYMKLPPIQKQIPHHNFKAYWK